MTLNFMDQFIRTRLISLNWWLKFDLKSCTVNGSISTCNHKPKHIVSLFNCETWVVPCLKNKLKCLVKSFRNVFLLNFFTFRYWTKADLFPNHQFPDYFLRVRQKEFSLKRTKYLKRTKRLKVRRKKCFPHFV
jgi:hypothetical protein